MLDWKCLFDLIVVEEKNDEKVILSPTEGKKYFK
jgi:hypothetical protein